MSDLNTSNPFSGGTVKASGTEPIPDGSYFATFNGVEAFSNEKVSGKLRWKFTVANGTQQGKMASALTDTQITEKNIVGRFVGGLLGESVKPGDDVSKIWDNLQQAVGKKYLIVFGNGKNGGKPSVQSVTFPPEM